VATTVHAPTAPGHYAELGVVSCRELALGEPVNVEGPLILAFDGERKRRLHAGERAVLTLERAGPRVVDIAALMRSAARTGRFVRQS
jgi:hypothetical protein